MKILLTAEQVKHMVVFPHNDIKLIPTVKYLEKCFKVFTRFLKENNRYSFIMNHIFPNKKGKEGFFADVKIMYSLSRKYNFKDILHMPRTLGDYDRGYGSPENSFEYWKDLIQPLSEKWKIYFPEHQPEIEDDDFMSVKKD